MTISGIQFQASEYPAVTVCILSQEKCVFGRFLKEVGKRSRTTGNSISHTGKAVSYSGQQLMCVRVPLMRLQQETQTFRAQAVHDTKQTIQTMEKERTEYRAALSWMKSASSELDPDTGKGLDKFRTAQMHVREAKRNFDSISMDCIQKIDLLAAARCNMYSQALIAYMNELKQFAQKTASTFQTISAALMQKPKYDFCVLKELTQDEGGDASNNDAAAGGGITDIVTQDKDQSLFFADEYSDQQAPCQSASVAEDGCESLLIELPQQMENMLSEYDNKVQEGGSQALCNLFAYNDSYSGGLAALMVQQQAGPGEQKCTNSESSENKPEIKRVQDDTVGSKASWLNLFAEIDPLTNPDAFNMKLNGGRTNFQQT